MFNPNRILISGVLALALSCTTLRADPPETKSLAKQTEELFLKAFGSHPGFRLAHAKGIVCHGTFEPAKAAAELSKAAHFKAAVPVIVRFSDGTGVPMIPDGDPHSDPKGMAIRFQLPGGDTDIVANGQNGFVVGTPEDFVGFLGAVIATKPDSPKPTPIETFLGSHPATMKFLGQPNPTPASFATQAYYGNNAFIFVSAQGKKQAIRYQILPLAGESHLDADAAAKKPADFIMTEIRDRLAKGPADFRLIAQLAAEGDPTSDATKVWPDDRVKAELGTIHITTVDADSDKAQKDLAFDPINLTDGIELSDDPLPKFRSKVYALSVRHRE
jgi:catalase